MMDLKLIKAMELDIVNLHEEMSRLAKNLRHAEKFYQHALENHYVLAMANESFGEHMVDVDYSDGFYETVEDARLDAVHYPEGWAIFDLTGKEIERSNRDTE